MRLYHYRCNDFSLLTPVFKRWLVAPLINIIPWAIPANIITLFSNCFVYAGLFIALYADMFGVFARPLVALFLLIYLIGDHLDGMQAKRTGTGSALGEFCDHYLDAFNNGVIVYTVFSIFEVHNVPIIVGTIIASYLAHMAVFYEQFKTGWLTFEPLGSLEGVLLSALLIGLSVFGPIDNVLTYPLVAGVSVIECVMLGSAAGGIMTFIRTWKRTPNVSRGFWLFTILIILLGIGGQKIFISFELFVLLTLYASLYIGRIMVGHLIDGVERNADWLTPISVLILASTKSTSTNILFWFLIAYLMMLIIVLIVQTFSALKKYWVWTNARTPSS